MVRAALTEAKRQARVALHENFQMAVDYLEGRQLDDVERELRERYERTQTGDIGGQIAAQILPLTERYIAEAANAYNRPVTRRLVRADGTVDEERTRQLSALTRDSSYDEYMHRVDQYTVLLKTCCLWYQARGGKLRPVVVYPHDVWPVMPDDDWAQASDQDDYAGHVVELYNAEDESRADGRSFAWTEPAQTIFYSGGDPFTPHTGGVTRWPNVFDWPQTVDADGHMGETVTLPLQTLTYWHYRLPIGELIVDTDPSIALANREINLQLSILLDTLAHQGWATMLLSLLNPDSPPTTFSAGPRSGLAIGAGETASLLSSGVSYNELVSVLQATMRMLAIAHRQSPSDFSTEAAAATSGFAKMVDSLPKIEARDERIARLKATEAKVAWPRLGSIGLRLGYFAGSVEELAKLSMLTEFSALTFPRTSQERTLEEAHDIAHGMTTPAKLLAAKRGITIAEAELEVDANRGLVSEEGDTPADDASLTPVLDAAQVASLQGVVSSVVERKLPRDSAVQLIVLGYPLTARQAEDLLGTAGAEPPEPPPAAAPPPAPAAPPPVQRESLLGRLLRDQE